MKISTTFSPREKRYQFLYLVGILTVIVSVFTLVIYQKFHTSLSEGNVLETQMLEQRNKFNQQQAVVEPVLESAYRKINILKDESLQPFAENDIKNSINDIANSFSNAAIYDTRKEGYLQIAEFYKMYFEDKKIAAKKSENIKLFEKQFEECSIGFNNREQQLLQRRNAILSRSGQ